MNAEFECERTLLVQADFDGELDAAQAAALIEHERHCAHCQRVRGQLARSRELLRAAPRFAASDELREGIARRLHAADAGFEGEGGVPAATSWLSTPPRRPLPQSASDARAAAAPRTSSSAPEPVSQRERRFTSAARRVPLAWVSALAAAAALVVVVLLPRGADVGSQLIANHVRAMQLESHLIDVVSTDHHTVKPWFAGKVSFAPVVKQLDSSGYILKGGRVDIVNGAPAAVLVYQAGRHIIDVYMWPASSSTIALRTSTQIEGFNLRHWQEGGLTVWCVSDMSADELDHFVQRWQQ